MDIQARKPNITLPWRDNGSIPLWRLDHVETMAIRQQTLAIEDDYRFLMVLTSSYRPGIEPLPLGKVRSVLRDLTGASDPAIDKAKQSFCFPFLHSTPADRPTANYMLRVQDIRGSLYFTSGRVVAKDDPRLAMHLLHKPFPEEFSREDLNLLAATFYGFLEGYSRFVTPQPFVEKICSDNFIYGYAEGRYFKEQYLDDHEVFLKAYEKWMRIVSASTEQE